MRLLLALALLVLAGCDATQSDEGFVRFVHAAPNAAPVSLFLGDIQEEDIAFGRTLVYQAVEVGDPRVRVRLTENADRRYIDQLVRVEKEALATLVLLDTTVSKPYLYLEDDTPGSTSEPRNLRLVQAAPGIGIVDVFEAEEDGALLSGAPVATLRFRGNTGFVGVRTGVATLVAAERDAPFRRFIAQPKRGRTTVVLIEQNGLMRGVELDETPPVQSP